MSLKVYTIFQIYGKILTLNWDLLKAPLSWLSILSDYLIRLKCAALIGRFPIGLWHIKLVLLSR